MLVSNVVSLRQARPPAPPPAAPSPAAPYCPEPVSRMHALPQTQSTVNQATESMGQLAPSTTQGAPALPQRTLPPPDQIFPQGICKVNLR